MIDIEKVKHLPFKNLHDLMHSVEDIKKAHLLESRLVQYELDVKGIPYTEIDGDTGGLFIDADLLTSSEVHNARALINNIKSEFKLVEKAYDRLNVKYE